MSALTMLQNGPNHECRDISNFARSIFRGLQLWLLALTGGMKYLDMAKVD